MCSVKRSHSFINDEVDAFSYAWMIKKTPEWSPQVRLPLENPLDSKVASDGKSEALQLR